MVKHTLSSNLAVGGQIEPSEVAELAAAGVTEIVCNRPDGESDDQPSAAEIAEACAAVGVRFTYAPVEPGTLPSKAIDALLRALERADSQVFAYCRTGRRSATVWAQLQDGDSNDVDVARLLRDAGFAPVGNADADTSNRPASAALSVDVAIIGGGAGGLAVAASLLKRRKNLDVVIIEPKAEHFYQPGFTLVGGGVFAQKQTVRPLAPLVPKGARLITDSVCAIDAERDRLTLSGGDEIAYKTLVAAPGIELNWAAIDGAETWLGRNGVTSNYRWDLAPYTWQQVQNLRGGRAVFTQPPMPIKCAGAPQKALYLSADHWRRSGRLDSIDIEFYNAGAVLFGVPDYVPALEGYMRDYGTDLKFQHTLKAVDGGSRKAWFDDANSGEEVEVEFDLLHLCPPQRAPGFIRDSVLADAAGYIEVDQHTLQHPRFANVFGLGDGAGTANAKTAAAVRKQAPVVAENLLSVLDDRPLAVAYSGYGSCPLTVERGKVVLAEFGYGGALQPTVPTWLNDGTRATWLGWLLKARMLPPIYYHCMLKGREWLAAPQPLNQFQEATA